MADPGDTASPSDAEPDAQAHVEAHGRTAGDDPRERWNTSWQQRAEEREPAAFLTRRAHLLPDRGRVLDVAGGDGRNAVWLAQHGLEVTLVDVSDVAVDRAAARAAAAGVSIEAIRRDVERRGLPPGPWDVIVITYFLDRAVLRQAPGLLAVDGLLLFAHPTVRNLERHDRPSRAWLLAEGELDELTAALDGVEVVEASEGWTEEDRHEARLVARRVSARRSGRPRGR